MEKLFTSTTWKNFYLLIMTSTYMLTDQSNLGKCRKVSGRKHDPQSHQLKRSIINILVHFLFVSFSRHHGAQDLEAGMSMCTESRVRRSTSGLSMACAWLVVLRALPISQSISFLVPGEWELSWFSHVAFSEMRALQLKYCPWYWESFMKFLADPIW